MVGLGIACNNSERQTKEGKKKNDYKNSLPLSNRMMCKFVVIIVDFLKIVRNVLASGSLRKSIGSFVSRMRTPISV